MTNSKSIDKSEVEKFSNMADQWWDTKGKFAPLHKFNPVRIKYIKERCIEHFAKKDGEMPLKGLNILDIGCGGGLLSEPLCRLGASMTSIDAGDKNIKIAATHAAQAGLKINYMCTSAEALATQDKRYDVVLNMEVIEHVADVTSFMKASCKLVKPGGMMIVATLNRTVKSYALAIIGAEYILRWLPKGTHSWEKFLKPSEIEAYLSDGGLNLQKIQGVSYNPLSNDWSLSSDINVNYMLLAVKPA